MKQWRKETFGDVNGVQMPANWKPEGLIAPKERKEEAMAGKVDIKGGDGERKKKRRKKNKA